MEDIFVRMIRPNLDDLPHFDLPAPYSLRTYRPGDEKGWVRLHLDAEPFIEKEKFTVEFFYEQFNDDPEDLGQRQFYLCDAAGRPIGSASAWFDPQDPERDYGRVHWVVIETAAQGQGLAKPLLAAVCRRMVDLGHQRAFLDTSTGRLAALNLYLKFGFVPQIRHDEDLRAWRLVREVLSHPALERLTLEQD